LKDKIKLMMINKMRIKSRFSLKIS